MTKKYLLLTTVFTALLALSACGQQNQDASMDHSSMNHTDMQESKLPAGMKEAVKPAYPKGEKVRINADHMAGMKGAEGTVAGAYDTTVYTVSYQPEDGGQPVKNHKWVIHEEIKNAGKKPFKKGEEVTLNADHMPGMMGAKATIDSATPTTVYMVNYTDQKTGKKVTNHKWVTQDELAAIK